jgi:hypothetical protein
MEALVENLKKYEERFGKISEPNQGGDNRGVFMGQLPISEA